jgi:hypothetical protein
LERKQQTDFCAFGEFKITKEFHVVRFLIAVIFIGAATAIGAAPAAVAAGPYANCSEAHADGRYNIPQDDPDYWEAGDRDGDGYACEPKP